MAFDSLRHLVVLLLQTAANVIHHRIHVIAAAPFLHHLIIGVLHDRAGVRQGLTLHLISNEMLVVSLSSLLLKEFLTIVWTNLMHFCPLGMVNMGIKINLRVLLLRLVLLKLLASIHIVF